MDNRLVLLLVAYFVAELVSTPALSTPDEAGKGKSATTLTAAQKRDAAAALLPKRIIGPWSAVCEHFGKRPVAVAEDKGDQPALPLDVFRQRWCIPDASVSVRTLIVTLPDPRQTRLTLDFDRYIQTIERAVAGSGYTMDRFWLPWTAERDPAAGQASGVEDLDGTQQQPGLIWFRSAKMAKPNYLAAFLVGETPVAGLNQRAFGNAAYYARMLDNTGGLRVAGPFSSGGLPSLDRALRTAGYTTGKGMPGCAALHPSGFVDGSDVTIVSGTVTGDAQNDFASCWYFSAVASPDDETLGCLLLATGQTKLALLSESATSYGGQFRDIARTAGNPAMELAGSPAAAPGSVKCPPSDSPIDTSAILKLRFPREMAWLRKAYEEDPQLSQGVSPAESSGRRTLQGKLETEAVGTDAVPVFSRSQTPLLQEAELLAVAREVKEHHVSHMVVFATDILDTTFLARFFRKCCDVRPIIFEPDLYLSRRDGVPLPGTLAINRTVLLPHDQDHQVFTSGSVWGLFKSIELLLGQDPHLDRKSLWLSVVGKNGYWPVEKLRGEPIASWPLMPPRAWQNGMLAVTVMLLVFCWALTFPQRAGSAFGPRRLFWSFAITGELGRERCPYVLGALLSIAGVALMLGLPVLDLERLQVNGVEPWIVVFLLMLVTGAMLFAGVRIGLPKPRWLSLAVWGAFAATMGIWWLCLFTGPRALFFSVRAIHIESGVSPALPVICLILVLGAWSWTQVLRLRVYHERQPIAPAPDPSDQVWTKRTRQAFLQPLVQGPKMFAFAVAVIVLVCIAAGGGSMLTTIEGPLYDWTFGLMLLLVGVLVVMALARLQYAWRTLWDVLQHIETQPFREKFQEVGRDFNWYSIFQPGGGTVNLRPVDRSFECARELAHAAAGDEGLAEELELMSGLEPARDKFKNRLLTLRYATQGEAVNLAEETHAALVKAAEVLVRKYGDSPRPKNPSTTRDLIDEFISLQYVHYIRQVFVLFSQLASFVMTAFVLVVIAVNSYPFSQPKAISLWVLGSFLAVTAFVVIIFWQMDRDPILSRMSNTTGGKLDRHFWSLLLQYGGLPVLAVLGSQFPELGGILSRWLGATGDLLK